MKKITDRVDDLEKNLEDGYGALVVDVSKLDKRVFRTELRLDNQVQTNKTFAHSQEASLDTMAAIGRRLSKIEKQKSWLSRTWHWTATFFDLYESAYETRQREEKARQKYFKQWGVMPPRRTER